MFMIVKGSCGGFRFPLHLRFSEVLTPEQVGWLKETDTQAKAVELSANESPSSFLIDDEVIETNFPHTFHSGFQGETPVGTGTLLCPAAARDPVLPVSREVENIYSIWVGTLPMQFHKSWDLKLCEQQLGSCL